MLVYVCSSLRPQTAKRVDKILVEFRRDFPALKFFRPKGTSIKTMMKTVREDVRAIEACDELWVVGRFGRDCSWEIGYAMALRKLVVFWEDHTNKKKWWSDWMWRIGIDRHLVKVRKL